MCRAACFLPQSDTTTNSSSTSNSTAALKGFSITGSLDKSLRNYGRMWEQIAAYREREGAAALQNFRLNILGDVMGDFAVPGNNS